MKPSVTDLRPLITVCGIWTINIVLYIVQIKDVSVIFKVPLEVPGSKL